MAKLLIVDNQRVNRKSMAELLENEKYNVAQCGSVEECKAKLSSEKYDLIIYNSSMAEMDGLSFIHYMNNKGIDSAIVMTIDKLDLDYVIKCVREGVVDFILQPFNVARLLISVRNALVSVTLKKECKQLHKKVIATIPEIIGDSKQILAIKAMIKKVAATDAKVLITGSNGTGKELVAHWLHELSNRKAAPLIEVNCAAMPNELIESELFGHEKGSFTSADNKHIGKFEQANGGTIFLDEIGDMSLSAQAKVLRVLQEGKVWRVGSTKEISVDVRVIAATNKNLKEEIIKGNFREDLYHRLNVIPIHVPSLNERTEDIPLLINQFISILCKRRGEEPKEITPEALRMLQNRAWTGNIRELQNVVERLYILCDDKITSEDIETHCCC